MLSVVVLRVIPSDVSSMLFARESGFGRFSTRPVVCSSPGFFAGTAFDEITTGILCVSFGMNSCSDDVPLRNCSIVSGPPNLCKRYLFGAGFVGTYFLDACCLIRAKSC